MTNTSDRPERRERAIAALLWYGTWIASALIAAGLVLLAFEAPSADHALTLTGSDLVRAGVAVFILLPIARVVLMVFLFLRERDYVYAAIAALVLAIIATGVIVAR